MFTPRKFAHEQLKCNVQISGPADTTFAAVWLWFISELEMRDHGQPQKLACNSWGPDLNWIISDMNTNVMGVEKMRQRGRNPILCVNLTCELELGTILLIHMTGGIMDFHLVGVSTLALLLLKVQKNGNDFGFSSKEPRSGVRIRRFFSQFMLVWNVTLQISTTISPLIVNHDPGQIGLCVFMPPWKNVNFRANVAVDQILIRSLFLLQKILPASSRKVYLLLFSFSCVLVQKAISPPSHKLLLMLRGNYSAIVHCRIA